MLPKLSERLFGDWSRFFPDETKPQAISYLGIAGSVEGGTCTFLGFPKNRKKPLFAVKIHRAPDAGGRVSAEQEVLTRLGLCEDALSGPIPRAILCQQIGGVWMLVQSIVAGRLMPASLTKEGAPDLAEAAINFQLAGYWLARMHSATRHCDGAGVAVARQGVASDIEAFIETFELSVKERERVAGLANAQRSWPDNGLYLRHGDFCRHNILTGRTDQKIGVIDWTFGEWTICPMDDLFFFLSTYFLQIREDHGVAGLTQAFEHTFFSKNGYSDVARRAIAEAAARLGVDTPDVRDMFALFLINRALFEHRQLAACAQSGGLPRFAVYLAALEDNNYHEALRSQLWIRFFRFFVEHEDHFIV
ncbi:MAG: aminoglycoside phosphotransferase family protein [Elusimicrobia bacterium]|nr:aminoglycoside phosphotransferase family protein [Elusimicrobiota bacterium]